MAVYVFNLMAGYYHGGIDYAQGARAKYLKKLSRPVKYVFTDVPKEWDVQQYWQKGIDSADMISAHFFLCGNGGLGAVTHITDKSYRCVGRQAIVEYYADRLLYTDYYTVDDNGNQAPKPVKRAFRKQDGTVAYDTIFDENGSERYLFPNGENLSKQEFLCKFIQQLQLAKEDIVLIDRPGILDFLQPLFTYGNRAKIMAFLHSRHSVEKGEASEFTYLNYEFYYWFKYSYMMHTMLVSTDAQKADLIDKLKEYGCHVPNVEVLPASGLDTLRYPATERKPYSLLTASRLDPGKKIDWIIRSVIKAHEICPSISVDIYGRGGDGSVYTGAPSAR